MDFAAQIPAVQTDKADMAMGAISVTEERQKQVLFSDGYVESHIVLMKRGSRDTKPHPRPLSKGRGEWIPLERTGYSYYDNRWRYMAHSS